MKRYEMRMAENLRGSYTLIDDVINLLWDLYEKEPTNSLAEALESLGEITDL